MSTSEFPYPLLGIRTITGQEGAIYLVADDFPEQFTVSDETLQKADHRIVSHDEQRRRLWVNVANGRAEYVTEQNTYNHTWTCRRLYRSLDW